MILTVQDGFDFVEWYACFAAECVWSDMTLFAKLKDTSGCEAEYVHSLSHFLLLFFSLSIADFSFLVVDSGIDLVDRGCCAEWMSIIIYLLRWNAMTIRHIHFQS